MSYKYSVLATVLATAIAAPTTATTTTHATTAATTPTTTTIALTTPTKTTHTAATAPTTTTTALTTPTTTNTVIKLHSSPSTESPVISDITLSKGITILPNDWVQVQDPTTKKVGWVTQQEVQNLLHHNNTMITTRTNNSNGRYSSVTEIHNFTTNGTDSAHKELASNIAAEEQKINQTLKKNMRYFQKMGEVTNGLFENIFG